MASRAGKSLMLRTTRHRHCEFRAREMTRRDAQQRVRSSWGVAEKTKVADALLRVPAGRTFALPTGPAPPLRQRGRSMRTLAFVALLPAAAGRRCRRRMRGLLLNQNKTPHPGPSHTSLREDLVPLTDRRLRHHSIEDERVFAHELLALNHPREWLLSARLQLVRRSSLPSAAAQPTSIAS